MSASSSTTTGKHWVTRPDQEIDVSLHMKSTGFASKEPITVVKAFKKTVELHGKRNALAAKVIVNVGIIIHIYRSSHW